MRQCNFVFDPKTGVIYDYKFTSDPSLANKISATGETTYFTNAPLGSVINSNYIVEIHP